MSDTSKLPNIKHSLRTRLTLFNICLLLSVILVGILVNIRFMEPYYAQRKVETLKKGYNLIRTITWDEVDEMLSAQSSELTSTEEQFLTYFSAGNLEFLLLNQETNTTLTNVTTREADRIGGRLFGYLAGLDDSNAEILENTNEYRLQNNRDFFSKELFVEIWGMTDTGLAFIIRTPMAGIKESAAIANRFFLYAGVVMALMGGILSWFLFSRVIRPVSELTEISKRMADQDFTARYTGSGMDEIGELGNNFNRMSDALETAICELKQANISLLQDIEKKEAIDEMRKEFLSNVTHELKTPIAVIQGYAEGLMDGIAQDEESRNDYCEVIADEAGKMNRMVRKLLTLNQLEFGNDQPVMSRFDLTELIRGILNADQLLFEQKAVTVQFDGSSALYVWADEFKVEEVLTNYLSNALNHIDRERILDVKCHRENGTVRVSVFNTGNPIPEEDLDKIWIKFYKVDKARTRAYGGSGIGLSIVKAIMDSLGQSCGVVNYTNGVEFWFTLEEATANKESGL